jgi:hypothetical protein
MRVSNWNPSKFDGEFTTASMGRLRKAAEVVADKKGDYPNEPWTAREAGSLLKSVRVTEKKEQYGTLIAQFKNIRIYVGNYLVWYAAAFEYAASRKRGHAFLRPALNSLKSKIREILENG